MHVAIPLYPRFTALDVVGPYTVLAFAPGVRVTLVGPEPGPVTDDRGTLTMLATAGYADVTAPDVVLVPGGLGTFDVLGDQALLGWIRTAHENATRTTSVCSGSLLLGEAGLLDGLRATSHWAVVDHLATYGATPVRERVVDEGRIVTAAGVSAGIDMALTLLDKETAHAVQLAIEYDPQPPFPMDHAYAAQAGALLR